MTPQINWKAETLEGYNDVIVTAELSEALPDGAALKFCAYIEGDIKQVDNKDMTATGKANEYTIKLSEVLPKVRHWQKTKFLASSSSAFILKRVGFHEQRFLQQYIR